jgi:hypothetical protein
MKNSTSNVEDNATRFLMPAAFFWDRTRQVGQSQQQVCSRIPIARLKLAQQALIKMISKVAQTSHRVSIASIYTITVE